MKTWTNTNHNGDLNECDRVEFTFRGKTVSYTVQSNHLGSETGNDIIFQWLGLNPHKFASNEYGYDAMNARSGNWPESRARDMDALTFLVLGLYEEIARQEKRGEVKKSPEVKEKSHILSLGDHVNFILNGYTYHYIICATHLNESTGENNRIFQMLNLTKEQMGRWASKCYGYFHNTGQWPESKYGDYVGLTNFVNDITRVVREVNSLIEQEDCEIDDIDVLKIIFSPPPEHLRYKPVMDGNALREFLSKESERKKSTPNSSSNNQLNQLTNGNTIKVSRLTPSIRRGEKKRGRIVRGKTNRVATKLGYLSNGTIFG